MSHHRGADRSRLATPINAKPIRTCGDGTMQRQAIPVSTLLTLLAIPFLVMTGSGMMFPLLAVVADSLGAGQTGAGVLLASFAAARLASNFPAGLGADRFGWRPVAGVGLAILAAGSLGAVLASGLAATAVCIALIGVGSSSALTATLAQLSDLADAQNRGLMMSRYQTAVLVGISLGPLGGGLLSARYGLSSPFLLQGVMALAAMAPVFVLARTRVPAAAKAAASQEAASQERSSLTLILSAGFGVLCLVSFTLFMTRTATSWQIVPLIARDRFAMSPETIGLLLTSGALANLAAQPVIGRLIDRLGAPRAVLGGGAAMIASFLLVSSDASAGLLWAGVILMGLASGVLAPAINTFAVEVSGAGYGATLGTLRTAGDGGLVLGPIILGPGLALLGVSHEAGLVASAATMLLSLAAFVAVHRRRLFRARL